jgi:hypothetical protein
LYVFVKIGIVLLFQMKKRQMKAQLLMESKGVKFEVIDIADPNSEAAKMFMQKNSTAKANARNPIPPQFFQEDEYCGDYDGFDEANENDCLEEFLKLPKGKLTSSFSWAKTI